jgi:hypothetical protein
VRRVPHIRLAVVLAAGAVAAAALLAPGVSYATASQSVPAVTAAAGCRGVTPAAFPALGFITDPARTQGGHLWWRSAGAGSVCIGTVVEWVQYNTTATKTWRVVVYTTADPGGQTVAQQTVTAGRGWRFHDFGVHQAYQGLTAVCLTADESFGSPCIEFVQPPA